MTLRTLLLCLAAGCSGEDPSEDDAGDDAADTDSPAPQGACGEVTTWDVTVVGRVRGLDGGSAGGVDVQIEDRVWYPDMVYGTTITDAAGAFEITMTDLVSVEGCWGMLGYYAVAETAEAYGEAGINQPLFLAISDGTLSADISDIPIQLELKTTER